MSRAAQIDAWLPQTQCRRCGYPRCRAYAEAIARGETGIDRCPPGGEVTRTGLAALLRMPVPPPDPACGEFHERLVARVEEDRCIGCTLCIQACPVDAIVGSSGFTHTVVEAECTGCELCIPACPVDCILTAPASLPEPGVGWRWPEHPPDAVERARERTEARLSRLARERSRRARRGTRPLSRLRDRETVRAELAAVLARARDPGRPR